RRALTGEPELHAVVDAGGNLGLDHMLGPHAALAMARRTRIAIDLSLAAALRAWARDREEPVAHADLAATMARLAWRRARALFRPAAAARLARLEARDADLRLDAGGRFLERDLQLVLEIVA